MATRKVTPKLKTLADAIPQYWSGTVDVANPVTIETGVSPFNNSIMAIRAVELSLAAAAAQGVAADAYYYFHVGVGTATPSNDLTDRANVICMAGAAALTTSGMVVLDLTPKYIPVQPIFIATNAITVAGNGWGNGVITFRIWYDLYDADEVDILRLQNSQM